MIARNILINVAIIIVITVFGITIMNDIPSSAEKRDLFPGILGNSVLNKNETGRQTVVNISSYDGLVGHIVQGYKATYSGENGTVIVFVAQMSDNISANKSFHDMIAKTGYNRSLGSNQSIKNYIIVARLPVENPEIFAIQKNRNETLHYTFTKLDKVYWIGFSKHDVEYEASILFEVYVNVDKQKSSFDI